MKLEIDHYREICRRHAATIKRLREEKEEMRVAHHKEMARAVSVARARERTQCLLRVRDGVPLMGDKK